MDNQETASRQARKNEGKMEKGIRELPANHHPSYEMKWNLLPLHGSITTRRNGALNEFCNTSSITHREEKKRKKGIRLKYKRQKHEEQKRKEEDSRNIPSS